MPFGLCSEARERPAVPVELPGGVRGGLGSAVPRRSQLHGLGTGWERGGSPGRPGLCTALPEGLHWGAPGGPPRAGDPSPGAVSARPAPALPAAVRLKFHLF